MGQNGHYSFKNYKYGTTYDNFVHKEATQFAAVAPHIA